MNVALLRSSFELVVTRKPDLVVRFYEILFERYPTTRSMFGRHSALAQQKMLTEALVAVVEHLEDPVWFESTLGALGARHAGYGVTDAMYAWVGDALLSTLAEAAGEAWNDELRLEWTLAYQAIASTMQAGARRAEGRDTLQDEAPESRRAS